MGCSIVTRREPKFVRLSRSIAVLAASTALVPFGVFAQNISEAFIAESVSHFRTSDQWRPRLGFLLDVATVNQTGMNFEFCDGERANLDISTLQISEEACDEFRPGTFTFANLSHFAKKNGIPLYNADYVQVGTISELMVGGAGSWGASAKFHSMSGGTLPQNVVDAISSTVDGKLNLSGGNGGLWYISDDEGSYEAVVTDWMGLLSPMGMESP